MSGKSYNQTKIKSRDNGVYRLAIYEFLKGEGFKMNEGQHKILKALLKDYVNAKTIDLQLRITNVNNINQDLALQLRNLTKKQ